MDNIIRLKQQNKQLKMETMLLSEAVLAKNWNTKEEDEAWESL